ncbi:uncharacterized protein LOC109857792 isoform X2 [Pseudomyrmex gracilis]|uniref:uncharacterized protein LOC109857792 isoform X2 n=1 Tax=Pseudomyrmex gracilis TaxID=219809 RepID=UPI000995213C|nr:uncharacterized protein LOC109857792 isoform X2 [Pseudomyrmex gracilis]
MEPPCRICSRLTPPPVFNPRALESRYKSSVTRRREYDPRRYDAKVGTDLKSELDSRFYNVGRIANKVQELKRNLVQDYDESKYFDRERLRSDARITDFKSARNAMQNCARELEKIKTFLEDENTWWKILKERSATCCEQTLPHLHGILDGSSVTLILFEEGIDEIPRRFATTASSKKDNIADFCFRNSSKRIPNEANYRTDWEKRTKEYTDSYAAPYTVSAKSTVVEVTNTDTYDSNQQNVVETTTKSNQNIVATELWLETRDGKRSDQKVSEWSGTSKETRDKTQSENKDIKTDRSNIVPPREMWYGENTGTTFEDAVSPRETFSSENTASAKYIDFESNVDMSSKLPSRNVTNHKLKSKETNEKGACHSQKSLPTKIPRIRKD